MRGLQGMTGGVQENGHIQGALGPFYDIAFADDMSGSGSMNGRALTTGRATWASFSPDANPITFTISSGIAGKTATASDNQGVVYNMGWSNMDVRATIAGYPWQGGGTAGQDSAAGLTFGYVDSTHYYKLIFFKGDWFLVLNNGGSETTLTQFAQVPVTGDVMRVTRNTAGQFTCYYNATNKATATDTTLAGSYCGLIDYGVSGRWSAFQSSIF